MNRPGQSVSGCGEWKIDSRSGRCSRRGVSTSSSLPVVQMSARCEKCEDDDADHRAAAAASDVAPAKGKGKGKAKAKGKKAKKA